MASSPAPPLDVSGFPGLSVRVLLSYFFWLYIAQKGVQHAKQHFMAPPSYPMRFSNTHNHHARDIAAGARRKRWKHWEGTGASEFLTARLEIDILFVRCAELV